MIRVIVAIIYIAAILIIGVRAGKNVKTADDFAVGGRNIPFWTNVYSMSSAWIGAGSTMGCASMCYAYGIDGFYLAISVGIGAMLASLLFAKKIREANVSTIPELIRNNLGARVASWISILAIIQTFGIAASQIRSLGTILVMFIPQLSLLAAILIMTVVMLIYTVIGGLVAAATTDKLNIALMLIAVLVIIPIMCLSDIGGIANLSAKVADPSMLSAGKLGMTAMLSSGLYFMTSNMLNSENFLRICGAKSADEARNASLTATVLVYIPYLLFASLAGLLGLGIIQSLGTSDSILPALISQKAGPLLGAILMAALLAAVMGTAASVTMLTSVTVTRDVICRIKPDLSKDTLNIQRIVMILVVALGIVVAYFGSSIVSIMENLGAPCGAALVPIFCGLFFWREKMNEKGSLITIAVAVIATLGWLAAGSPVISHFVFGLICSTITMFVANSVTYKGSEA